MRRWLLPVVLAGCGSDAALSTNERALAGDGLRSVDADAIVVETVEQSFSGQIALTPSDDVYSALHAAAAASITTAKAQLTPSGCLAATQSTLDPLAPTDPVIEYVMTGCTAAGHALDGTVTSTWSLGDTIRVAHEIELEIDGVPTTGRLEVEITQAEPETRQRSVALVSDGVVFEGAWFATYDNAGCGTKSGLATVTVDGGRTFRREDELTFCATETLEAVAGTLDLSRDGLALRVHLLGSSEAEVFTRGDLFAVGVDGLVD